MKILFVVCWIGSVLICKVRVIIAGSGCLAVGIAGFLVPQYHELHLQIL